MSTLAELVETLINTIDDCKNALREKGLTSMGLINLCNVDEYIKVVGEESIYHDYSIPKHNIEDYSSVIANDLAEVRTALENKFVETSEDLKITQIPDKIREITDCFAGSPETLFDGLTFKNTYPKTIIFTDQDAPSNATLVNWSKTGTASVVKWYDSYSDTLYISSRKKGVKIIFPEECNGMFYRKRESIYNTDTTLIQFDSVDTSKTKYMDFMFSRCEAVETLDLRNFDTRNVTNLEHMFYYCYKLKHVDLSSFDTSKVDNMRNMFYRCYSLQSLDLRNFVSSEDTYLNNMFTLCTSLETLNISNLCKDSLSKNMDDMFGSDNKLKTIYAPEWAYLPRDKDFGLFYNCTSLPEFDPNSTGLSMAKWVENGGYFTNPINAVQ